MIPTEEKSGKLLPELPGRKEGRQTTQARAACQPALAFFFFEEQLSACALRHAARRQAEGAAARQGHAPCQLGGTQSVVKREFLLK